MLEGESLGDVGSMMSARMRWRLGVLGSVRMVFASCGGKFRKA